MNNFIFESNIQNCIYDIIYNSNIIINCLFFLLFFIFVFSTHIAESIILNKLYILLHKIEINTEKQEENQSQYINLEYTIKYILTYVFIFSVTKILILDMINRVNLYINTKLLNELFSYNLDAAKYSSIDIVHFAKIMQCQIINTIEAIPIVCAEIAMPIIIIIYKCIYHDHTNGLVQYICFLFFIIKLPLEYMIYNRNINIETILNPPQVTLNYNYINLLLKDKAFPIIIKSLFTISVYLTTVETDYASIAQYFFIVNLINISFTSFNNLFRFPGGLQLFSAIYKWNIIQSEFKKIPKLYKDGNISDYMDNINFILGNEILEIDLTRPYIYEIQSDDIISQIEAILFKNMKSASYLIMNQNNKYISVSDWRKYNTCYCISNNCSMPLDVSIIEYFIAFTNSNTELTIDQQAEIIRLLLHIVELDDNQLNKNINHLSGGQKRRLLIIVVILKLFSDHFNAINTDILITNLKIFINMIHDNTENCSINCNLFKNMQVNNNILLVANGPLIGLNIKLRYKIKRFFEFLSTVCGIVIIFSNTIDNKPDEKFITVSIDGKISKVLDPYAIYNIMI